MSLLITTLLTFQFLAGSQVGDLRVDLTGMKKVTGDLYVALYATKAHYLDTAQHFRRQHIAIKNRTALSLTFQDLPPGTYAIVLFIDENQNKKLDTNLFGIPKEKYGFSGEKLPLFRAPTFEEAAFEMETGLKVIRIALK